MHEYYAFSINNPVEIFSTSIYVCSNTKVSDVSDISLTVGYEIGAKDGTKNLVDKRKQFTDDRKKVDGKNKESFDSQWA